jgi:rRNA maturation RNase YbeY
MARSNSKINLQITARYAAKARPALLRKAAQATLDQQGVKQRVELSIVITGNVQLRALNREFRHMDAPTDVLAFATDEHPQPDAHYLGDVIISYTQAKRQALAGGHSVEAELQLLVVHGVLHLLGHDHATRAEKSRMWRAQSKVLKQIGAAITEPKD